MLSELAADLRSRRMQLGISNPSERVHATFERSGLLDVIGATALGLLPCAKTCNHDI